MILPSDLIKVALLPWLNSCDSRWFLQSLGKLSVVDSVVQGGDSVWEGLRVYNGKVFKLEEHLDRMFDSAKALPFVNVPTHKETLIRNGMLDNAHIQLSLTRGKKVTSGMSPAFNLYGCTLIVLPEWKPPVYDNTWNNARHCHNTSQFAKQPGFQNSPQQPPEQTSLLRMREGNNAPADDAIMLDKDGYVSETNATNILIVKKGRVLTPHAAYCLPGITQATPFLEVSAE
ncbi:hypothetical protein MLD38_035912 [Melastoma candidum]|uniref:Uncharacterized protein n=1 Tax=Melastoma candidum TaxID=119954 RepID=A0ACB9LI95_9MYRT|nr:hypothetical protein MLD38_035912 [Melastoma candidum]